MGASLAGLACCAAEGAACCACSALTSCCCRGSSGGGKGPSTKLAKIFYLMLIVVSVVAALLLRAYGGDLFVHFYSFKFGCTGDLASHCFGNQAVYRVSFGVAAFFLFMLMGSASHSFFRGYWGLKIALYIILVAGSFFIPNEFFNVYQEIARIVSVVFLLLMIIILVDFAYEAQQWIEGRATRYEEESEYDEIGTCRNPYLVLYLVAVFFMLAGAMAGLIAMYAFSSKHGCGGNLGLLSVTLIVGVVLTIMSVLEIFGGRGLLCPSMVFLYAVWLMWSAMSSNPEATCNPIGTESDNGWVTFLGCVVSGLSLAYSSYSAATSAPSLCGGGDDEDLQANLLETGRSTTDKVLTGEIESSAQLEAEREKEDAASAAGDDSDSEGSALRGAAASGASAGGKKEQPWFYCLIMLTASLYMAMLLSNWGTGETSGTAQTGKASMWIKIASQWVTYLLYAWTLVAPRIFPDREFS